MPSVTADVRPCAPIAVTGASGYVGGRLVRRLLDAGYRVRCLARDPRKLSARPWAGDERVERVQVELGDRAALTAALAGCGVAYYLVHSMISGGAHYAEQDRANAASFAHAAAAAGISRIIYLGGLGEAGADLSEHLGSRREVERVLAAGPVPVTVVRAAMIIGSGSASFEILRYLVERLPVMVTPRWVSTESQPIAIDNVLAYLVACLRTPATVGRTLDVGGPEVLTYRRLMEMLAEELGVRRRVVIPVPVLTPRLSALWIHLVTPVSHRVARPLAEGLRNRVVCRDPVATRLMPQTLIPVREAMRRALEQERLGQVETDWTDAGPMPGDPDWAGGTVLTDRRETAVAAPVSAVWRAVCRLGGDYGWYTDWLWRLRGMVDHLIGGPGLRRGRRDGERLSYGDTVDVWRVTALEPGRRVTLRAEMRLPGVAELQFAVESTGAGARLVQTARFWPRGLAGLGYWYAALPFHGLVFRRMLDGVRRAAEAEAGDRPRRTSADAAAGI
jgi:uncharacterized protein YbjT (DUF2867 family)